ncbi:hemolysin family protein [Patescibacteria group bacterium]|nr:hemolysin family protein [Patescibacteria group bacterium]MBU1703410.1 hemolysin family protein [Patescibacteria group bacterium]MBU1953861.1 hemolysin family protein [Patescibacteria group bacterium]
MNVYLEILLILGLILLNGFFAASEIAIISLRRSKTKELVKKGVKSALIVDAFQKDHQHFLATIQVGITVIGTFASAFGGASLVGDLAPVVRKIPLEFFQQYDELTAFLIVVILISYFSLVLGELVPKSLALQFTEKIALAVSYPIKFFSSIFNIFVKILTFSSNLVLKPLKSKRNFFETNLSEEEIRSLLEEGKEAGTIEKREHEILENVFEFGDADVAKVMIPHNRIDVLDVELDPEQFVQKMLTQNHTRIPVYEDQVDNIIGIIFSKDVFAKLARKQKINIRELLRPPLFVPNTQRLYDVMQKFKRAQMHMAIVLDEHGGVDGIVTLEDILEEIVGDIQDEVDKINKEIQKQADGSYLVDGSTSITDLNRVMETSLPEDAQYNSISGFILELVKRFPKKNEVIEYENLIFQIKEKTKKRIKTISVRKI